MLQKKLTTVLSHLLELFCALVQPFPSKIQTKYALNLVQNPEALFNLQKLGLTI